MLSGYFKNMINHLNPSQKTPLRQYFTETIMLQGFQAAKNRVFSTFLPYFLYILEAQTLSYLTKKRRNPYIYYVSEPYYFFL